LADVELERPAANPVALHGGERPAEEPPTVDAPLEAEPPLVTITGCLERSDDKFRLTDTTGVDAPKSRSWKSAFLTRRPAPVAITAAANDLNLSRHLGERIAVAGTLVDREMRVRSLRRVSASCEPVSKVKA
jgi:hypothetical protein